MYRGTTGNGKQTYNNEWIVVPEGNKEKGRETWRTLMDKRRT